MFLFFFCGKGNYNFDCHSLDASVCEYPRYFIDGTKNDHSLPYYIPFRSLTHFEIKNLLVIYYCIISCFFCFHTFMLQKPCVFFLRANFTTNTSNQTQNKMNQHNQRIAINKKTHATKKYTKVAGKNMAATFFANTALRLHPSEWTSGSAAGGTAIYMYLHNMYDTNQVYEDVFYLQQFLNSSFVQIPLQWT